MSAKARFRGSYEKSPDPRWVQLVAEAKWLGCASCLARYSPKQALERKPRIHRPATWKGGHESGLKRFNTVAGVTGAGEQAHPDRDALGLVLCKHQWRQLVPGAAAHI